MSRRVVVMGDVGAVGGELHMGDEAMTQALIDEFEVRGVEVSAIVSGEPAETGSRYGRPALARAGFDAAATPTWAARERRLADVTMALGGKVRLDPGDPAAALIDAIGAADGLVIAGGGNLTSVWPEHIYERSALVAIASALGKRIVVTGQTLGPALTARDGELVAEMLGRADLIGVRERESFALAGALGIPADALRLTRDDAMWLEGSPFEGALPASYCAVTIAPHSGLVDFPLFARTFAELLDTVGDTTGLDLVFVPHVGMLEPGTASGDQLAHQEIIAGMRNDRLRELPVLSPRQVATVTRGAELSISTRYHSTVFASGAGVPTVGISVDEYTGIKIGGALEQLGLGEFALPSTMVASGQAHAVVRSAWERRREIREHVAALESTMRQESARWWDDTVAVITGGSPAPARDRPPVAASFVDMAISTTTSRMRAWQYAETSRVIGTQLAFLERDEEMPPPSMLDLQRRLGASEAALADAEQRAAHAEFALEAARSLAAKVAEPMFEKRLGTARVPTPASEVEALLNSRTFRWTAGARRAYGHMRGIARRLLLPFRR